VHASGMHPVEKNCIVSQARHGISSSVRTNRDNKWGRHVVADAQVV